MAKGKKRGGGAPVRSVQGRLVKGPTVGPGASSVPLGPGFGSSGGVQSTQSPAALAPRPHMAGSVGQGPAGQPRTGHPPVFGPHDSKYNDQVSNVPYTIQDVDISRNWFSPFQPITPFGPPNIQFPREWDYPTGDNLNFTTPRMVLMQKLRLMSRSWGVLRAIIQTRKDQMLRLPWEFQVRDKPRKVNNHVQEMRDFFRRPDGKRTFVQWSRMILEDLFVIDAPTLYVGHRNMGGQPLCVEVLDGATIKVLIDDAGRVPDYPSPAYQQVIKGLPMVNFDESELVYAPMNPTPENPIYGFSPVEHIYMEVNEAIRKTMYTLGFWTEGNLPDLIMSVPKDWTPTQIASFQALMDSELSGNLARKSKMRFVPEGMRPYDIKNASGEGLASQRDEMLIRLACYAFSVSPTPFIKGTNRATAQSAAEQATQEGLYPLMEWFKSCVMDRIIQDEFGYDDVEFVWKAQPEVDQLKRSQIFANYVRAGIMSIDEIRDQMDMQPVPGGEQILIYTNNGVATLQDAIAAGRLASQAPDPAAAGDGSNSAGGGRPSGAATESGAQRADAEKVLALHEDVVEDTEDLYARIHELEQQLEAMNAAD